VFLNKNASKNQIQK